VLDHILDRLGDDEEIEQVTAALQFLLNFPFL
jgi:hypothetical protein